MSRIRWRQGIIAVVCVLLSAGAASSVRAETFLCEVMTVKGSATVTDTAGRTRSLKEGELLGTDDTVNVPAQSRVVLAFDREWKNLTIIRENSRVRIESIHPTGLFMEHGDLLMKLDQLPNETTFEVQTPVGISAVRGSLFQTSHRNRETLTLNFDSSEVMLFVLDLDGALIPSPLALLYHQKGSIEELNKNPEGPFDLTPEEIKEIEATLVWLEEIVDAILKDERWAKLKTVQEIADILRADRKSGPLTALEKARRVSDKIVRHNLERANRNSDRKSQRKLDADDEGIPPIREQ